MSHSRDQFLATFDRELATTMKVLRAYPEDQLDLKPSPRSNSARQLAWTFAMECHLGENLWNDAFRSAGMSGEWPQPPDSWNELLQKVEESMGRWRALVAGASEESLTQTIAFFVAPKTMGEIPRIDVAWMLLHDQIHHRGQFSVYLRIAGAKVPSIYGPSGDEPWM